MKTKTYRNRRLVLLLTAIFMFAVSIAAQTTAFTFQGRLNTSGNPASGTYEMQFQLFDTVKGGTQIGATVTDTNVAVVNGVFTTTLDFGAAAFDGSARFVEIGVRVGGNPDPFTVLAPRQTIKSAPYSIQSKNAATADGLSAACVNCVTSGQIESIDGSQVTGAIPPASVPTGSNNYIQNAAVFRGDGKDGGQPAASLNIGGNATVGSLDVNGPASLAAIGAPAVAPAGQGRIYFDSGTNKVKVSENGGAFVNLVGATGISGSGAINSIPLFSSGTTLGSSLISQSGGTTILMPAFITLAATASGNNIGFGSPNSGTGMTISGPTNRADVRLDGAIMRLAAGPAGGPPGNGIAINAAGNVGISTTAPAAKLDIATTGDGAALLQFTTERPWVFKQIRTGPSTGLQLQSLSGAKKFEITTVDGFNVATFLAESGTSRVGIGTTDPLAGTALHVIGTTRSSVVEITGGSDLAEKFEFSEEVKPGMVVAIDAKNAGKLQLARGAYNRRVAGIISGANNLAAGMILPDVGDGETAQPVALSGRVWVYCDASKGAIKPGDLLTTSNTPGHAMKVINHPRAQGAVIGKAMTELKSGTGLVLVLVSLQ